MAITVSTPGGLVTSTILNDLKSMLDQWHLTTGDLRSGSIPDGSYVYFDSGRILSVGGEPNEWLSHDGDTASTTPMSPTDISNLTKYET